MDAYSKLKAATPKFCKLQDRYGNAICYGNAGDFWHPPFPIGPHTDYRTHARLIRNFEIRDDDIIICSYPKTGVHWHVEIISMLLARSAEHKAFPPNLTLLDHTPIQASTMDRPSPRILVTHYPFRHLPKQMWTKPVRVVHLVRNPKDVLVSNYNHLHMNVEQLGYEGTFQQFATLCLESGYYYGDIFDHFMEWQEGKEANPQVEVFTSVYEELKKDPVAVVERLNAYLGTNCSKELCKDIAEASEFSKVKGYRDANTRVEMKATFKNPDSSIYRKGIVGDWRNWFSPELLELYDQEFQARMADYKIKFD